MRNTIAIAALLATIEAMQVKVQADAECQCFANAAEHEPFCEDAAFDEDPWGCEEADGRCHWGPGENPECRAQVGDFRPPPKKDFNEVEEDPDFCDWEEDFDTCCAAAYGEEACNWFTGCLDEGNDPEGCEVDALELFGDDEGDDVALAQTYCYNYGSGSSSDYYWEAQTWSQAASETASKAELRAMRCGGGYYWEAQTKMNSKVLLDFI